MRLSKDWVARTSIVTDRNLRIIKHKGVYRNFNAIILSGEMRNLIQMLASASNVDSSQIWCVNSTTDIWVKFWWGRAVALMASDCLLMQWDVEKHIQIDVCMYYLCEVYSENIHEQPTCSINGLNPKISALNNRYRGRSSISEDWILKRYYRNHTGVIARLLTKLAELSTPMYDHWNVPLAL